MTFEEREKRESQRLNAKRMVLERIRQLHAEMKSFGLLREHDRDEDTFISRIEQKELVTLIIIRDKMLTFIEQRTAVSA